LISNIDHGLGDVEEVLEEFRGQVLINVVMLRQLQRHPQQVEREHGHPTGAVGLAKESSSGQRFAAIEHADVVESEEAALEQISAVGVFPVHPPGESDQLLLQYPLQEIEIPGIVRI